MPGREWRFVHDRRHILAAAAILVRSSPAVCFPCLDCPAGACGSLGWSQNHPRASRTPLALGILPSAAGKASTSLLNAGNVKVIPVSSLASSPQALPSSLGAVQVMELQTAISQLRSAGLPPHGTASSDVAGATAATSLGPITGTFVGQGDIRPSSRRPGLPSSLMAGSVRPGSSVAASAQPPQSLSAMADQVCVWR
jgi:hypothetical protein